MMKDDLTLDDVMGTRLLASPLTKFDCSIVSDGGAAFIVTTNAKAKELGLKRDPVYLHGMGQGFSHQYLTSCEDLDQIYGAVEKSGKKAFDTAGMTNDNVDITFLYDCFTITTLLELEGLGIVPKGQAGAYALEGRLHKDADTPINTHGGLLSQAHLGAMHHVIEAVLQLRGEAGPRQVKDPNVALVHGNGGIVSAHSTIILGNEPVS